MAWDGSPGLATIQILQAQCGQRARRLKRERNACTHSRFVELHRECLIYERWIPSALRN